MNQTEKPDYIEALEAVYGPPSQEGFGSAVFYRQLEQDDSLEEAAQEVYQYFVGAKWEQWGAETWMGPWQQVYTRQADTGWDIIQELRGINDRSAASSVEMILDIVENAQAGQKALAKAFNVPEVQEVRVYSIGDGEAYSGLIVAGRRSSDQALFLVFLLD